MSSDFPKFGERSVSDRFTRVLRGRTPSRWANWLGISQGTLSRLKAGELPDPEKLTAACRAENLSLSWLLDGLGTPYLVNIAIDHRDAVRSLEQLFDDEVWFVLLVTAGQAATIVLHQSASVVLKDGSCEYRASVVLGGCYDAHSAVEQLGLLTDFSRPVQSLEVTAEQRARLAAGYMAATELFGWRDEPGGLAAAAITYAPVMSPAEMTFAMASVREPLADYGDAAEAERLMRELPEQHRPTVLQMLRGLIGR